MSRFTRHVAVSVSVLTAFLVAVSAGASTPQVTSGTGGMVVSVSAPASQVGVDVLKDGGTAVDAAVAVALAMQVTWPEAGNIGGGGFMMVHPGPHQAPVCIEYRETAPLAAGRNFFQPNDSTHTCKAVGVPGTLRGLELAHKKYGKLPWKRLVEPSVALARDGFVVDEGLAKSLNDVLHSLAPTGYEEFRRIYGKPDGTDWKAGDRLVQPELAVTMQLIADQGPDAFYSGTIAQQLVAEMKRGNGVITLDDLKRYEAKVRTPIHFRYRGFDIYGPPPPSSGGICLAEMMQMLETFDLRSKPRWSAENVHLQIEACRRAYLDRARYLGDSDFVSIPKFLTTPEHARELAKSIDPARATPSLELASDIPITTESSSTTHFSVVDGNGMAVSNTYTLENSYGSRVVVQGAGFLLNNEMGDFNWFSGVTTPTGRIGTEANLIAPGKRMLSSQTPVIVLKEGETRLVTGSPGGRTIINTVLCILMNVLEFEMDLETAVAQPRFHHQWLPDRVQIERSAEKKHAAMIEELRQMGHTIRFVGHQGDVHSISRDPATGKLQGVADTRLSGSAQGF